MTLTLLGSVAECELGETSPKYGIETEDRR